MQKIILIFGASSTYGAGDPEGGWATRLRHKLDESMGENGVSQTLIYNLGISGGTSEDIRARFRSETETRIRKDAETIFIFAGGGNDAAFVPSKQEFRVSPDRFAENMEYLITEANRFSPTVIIQDLTPVNDEVSLHQVGRDRSKSNEYVRQFNLKLGEVSEKHNIPIIHSYYAFMEAGHLNLLCTDGVHPNAKGHRLLAELALNSIPDFK